jgi:uncharacterized Fe-S radical SAM superfamily protein PflX
MQTHAGISMTIRLRVSTARALAPALEFKAHPFHSLKKQGSGKFLPTPPILSKHLAMPLELECCRRKIALPIRKRRSIG